jgi:hypothetical protein
MNRIGTWLAVLFTLGFPTVVTWLYFAGNGDSSPAEVQFRYAILKTIQFGFPIVWILLCRRFDRIGWPPMRGIKPGIVFGGAITGVIFAGYVLVLRGTAVFDAANQAAGEKLVALGLDNAAFFAAMGIFYALIHSLMEEYYWRWFVFGTLRELIPKWPAILISAIGFTAHHVILLDAYFGLRSLATVVFALSVTVGGIVWAWMYDRYGSLLGPWLGHLMIDAALFLVGFDMARSVLGR